MATTRKKEIKNKSTDRLAKIQRERWIVAQGRSLDDLVSGFSVVRAFFGII